MAGRRWINSQPIRLVRTARAAWRRAFPLSAITLEPVHDLWTDPHGIAVPCGLRLKKRVCCVEKPRWATGPSAVFALQSRFLRYNGLHPEIVRKFLDNVPPILPAFLI